MGYASSGVTKLSSVTIDADLVMGAHNITLDATQTVDGRDVSAYDSGNTGHVDTSESALENVPSASDTLKKSSDAEVEITVAGESPPTSVVKTITIPKAYKAGNFRIKYSVKNDGIGLHTRTQLRKNGSTLGAGDAKSYLDSGYEEISQDLAATGADVITLCGSDDTGSDGYVQNFRFYCTDAVSAVTGISWT